MSSVGEDVSMGVMILRSCFLVLVVVVEILLIMEDDDVIDDVGLTGWKIVIVVSSSVVALISFEVEGVVDSPRHVNIMAACNSSISSSSS